MNDVSLCITCKDSAEQLTEREGNWKTILVDLASVLSLMILEFFFMPGYECINLCNSKLLQLLPLIVQENAIIFH